MGQTRLPSLSVVYARKTPICVTHFTRLLPRNAHEAVHFPTHLILELWRYADFPVPIRSGDHLDYFWIADHSPGISLPAPRQTL